MKKVTMLQPPSNVKPSKVSNHNSVSSTHTRSKNIPFNQTFHTSDVLTKNDQTENNFSTSFSRSSIKLSRKPPVETEQREGESSNQQIRCAKNNLKLDKGRSQNPHQQVKFYEKTMGSKNVSNLRKLQQQNNARSKHYRQKIDSIKPVEYHEYESNKFALESRSRLIQEYQQVENIINRELKYFSAYSDQRRQELFCNQNVQKANTLSGEKDNSKEGGKSPESKACIGLINPMYINVKSNPKRLVNSCTLTREKDNRSSFILKGRSKSKKVEESSIERYNVQNKLNQRANQSDFKRSNNSQTYVKSVMEQPGVGNSSKERGSSNLYFKIVSEMNDYFNSMKLSSFKNNKTQFLTKRTIKSHSEKRHINSGEPNQKTFKSSSLIRDDQHLIQYQEQHLNVIGLKPKKNVPSTATSPAKVGKRLFTSSVQESLKASTKFDSLNGGSDKNEFGTADMQSYQSQQLVQNSYQNEEKQFLETKNQLINMERDRRSKFESGLIPSNKPNTIYSFTQQVRTSPQRLEKGSLKKNRTWILKIYYCFGELNLSRNSPQVIQRLRLLYFKDFIWKNSFSLGLRYVNQANTSSENSPSKDKKTETPNYRFLVGKGNNSRLIKRLMTKRWWWSIDSKEQNCQFVWTQLKIYSIYEKQESLNPKSSISSEQFIDHHQQPQSSEFERVLPFKPSEIQRVPFMNVEKDYLWIQYMKNPDNANRQKKATEENLISCRKKLERQSCMNLMRCAPKLSNHLQFSKVIGNKKALYKVMLLYYSLVKSNQEPKQGQKQSNSGHFERKNDFPLPLTYHITAGLQDDEYLRFLSEYYSRSKLQNRTCWIVKPGELTNRGRGIKYCKNLSEIKPIIKSKQTHANGALKTFLIQEYIDRPLLYKGRKFDIRHYIMISTIEGKVRGYFYQEGYIRTTSYRYRLDDNSAYIHLTNDAVQKTCRDFGKHEKGNKVSYEEFENYLTKTEIPFNCSSSTNTVEQTSSDDKEDMTSCNKKCPQHSVKRNRSFYGDIYPQIKEICTNVIHASHLYVDPKLRRNNFQIFGLDIMVDEEFKCFLIEVNTNPCLETSSSPILGKLIPQMLDNAFALTLDTCYPPPSDQPLSQYHKKFQYPLSVENKFELVFDQGLQSRKNDISSLIDKIYQQNGISESDIFNGVGDDDENFESEDDGSDHDY